MNWQKTSPNLCYLPDAGPAADLTNGLYGIVENFVAINQFYTDYVDFTTEIYNNYAALSNATNTFTGSMVVNADIWTPYLTATTISGTAASIASIASSSITVTAGTITTLSAPTINNATNINSPNANTGFIFTGGFNSAGAVKYLFNLKQTGASNTNSSGSHAALYINPTYAQSGTAAATDILVNRTNTSVGSGGQYLMDLQVNGSTKFRVGTDGNVSLGSGSFTGVYSITVDAGGIAVPNSTTTGRWATAANSAIGLNIISTVSIAASTLTSGNRVGVQIANSYNQTSGTASNVDLVVDRTETAVGSGTQAILDLRVGGVSKFQVSNKGKQIIDATMTAGGTTGNQTINKPAGSVNIAAGQSSITVTNSLVGTTSIVTPVVRTNDATAIIKNVVCSAGSFVITLSAATAETSIGFIVYN